ncbi:MAG: hypothetical protein ACI9MR_000023 [Myxococcota bacterium]|jgi:hypothetical protein
MRSKARRGRVKGPSVNDSVAYCFLRDVGKVDATTMRQLGKIWKQGVTHRDLEVWAAYGAMIALTELASPDPTMDRRQALIQLDKATESLRKIVGDQAVGAGAEVNVAVTVDLTDAQIRARADLGSTLPPVVSANAAMASSARERKEAE